MGSKLVEQAPRSSYTEQFKAHLPFYLSIGMTFTQYWDEDCELVKFYRQANELRTSRRNQELWLQGMYIYEALCDVSPVLHAFAKSGTKPNPYPDRPYAITTQEIKDKKEAAAKAARDSAKAVFRAWAAKVELIPEGGGENVHD